MKQTHVITLTSQHVGEWPAEWVNSFLARLRLWGDCKGADSRIVWVMEVQRDGRQHAHVAFSLPRGALIPVAEFTRWWPHGHFAVFKRLDAHAQVIARCGRGWVRA
jgi:hypothetical protein